MHTWGVKGQFAGGPFHHADPGDRSENSLSLEASTRTTPPQIILKERIRFLLEAIFTPLPFRPQS